MTTAQLSTLESTPSPPRFWQLPAPTQAVPGWHVSPLVDVMAYQFSWLWILVPFALAGEVHPADYLVLWAIGVTVGFVHRHVTMPYVYLDGGVFSSWKPRLTLMPAVLFCAFVASIALQQGTVPPKYLTPLDVALLVAGLVPVVVVWWRDRRSEPIPDRHLVVAALPAIVATVTGLLTLPGEHTRFFVVVTPVVVGAVVVVVGRRSVLITAVVVTGVAAAAALSWGGVVVNERPFRTASIVAAAAMVATLWNVWHVAAQKVGILRVYNAKSSAPVERKVPLWVDRLLVVSWFPFLAAFLVEQQRTTILTQGKIVKMYLTPLVDGVTAASPVLYPVGVATIVGALGAFLWHEHRATGLRSVPRLGMALGMTLLSASFLVASPLKVYAAWGFSHAVEYIVFVWAFQRRRYAVPLEPRPLLQRLLSHGALLYGAFIAVIAGFYLWGSQGVVLGLVDRHTEVFGLRLPMLIYLWAIWHSMAHFYFDGFLWKMRPTVRAAL